uniref:Uncharacterized protein n=1 Tax=Rhizophora mucronata TaxID=61149 RepID=A0A2P2Q4S7_RHIMU
MGKVLSNGWTNCPYPSVPNLPLNSIIIEAHHSILAFYIVEYRTSTYQSSLISPSVYPSHQLVKEILHF